MSSPASDAVGDFVAVMRRLRAECPWKAEQTHRSLARYLLEETHETLEAIDVGNESGDWSHLREELGDLLLQVVFHAVIAEETGQFDLADVAGDITAKMRRRNPHVFGQESSSTTSASSSPRGPEEVECSRGTSDRIETTSGRIETPPDAAAVTELWEQAKAAEKRLDELDDRARITRGLPPTLPALLYADKVLDRLAREGRSAPVEVRAKRASKPRHPHYSGT